MLESNKGWRVMKSRLESHKVCPDTLGWRVICSRLESDVYPDRASTVYSPVSRIAGHAAEYSAPSPFGVWGLEFGVWDFEFRVWSFGFWVSGLEFRASGFGFGVWGLRIGVCGLGFRGSGFEFRFGVAWLQRL